VVEANAPQPALTGVRWTLVELDGQAVVDDVHTPYLELDAEPSTLSGSGGCNRLVGSYESSSDGIRLGPVATTLRACDEQVMRREAAFLDALEAVDGLELDALGLALLADGRVLARLVRRPYARPVAR
jgi:heat shock protein HslJ